MDLVQDARFSLRKLLKEKAFTFPALLLLAIGIGAGCSTFAVLNHFLLRPPERVRQPERLAVLQFEVSGRRTYTEERISYLSFLNVKDAVSPLFEVSAEFVQEAGFGRGAGSTDVTAAAVGRNYFELAGVQPLVGSGIESEDTLRSQERTAVLSYDFWQRQFGGSSGIVGETCFIANRPYVIVGVLPRGFTGIRRPAVDVWLPLTAAADDIYFTGRSGGLSVLDRHQARLVRLTARLPEGADAAALESLAAASIRESEPDLSGLKLLSLADSRFGRGAISQLVRWGSATSALVLLVACANVANLLLLRNMRRRTEVAVELSLGIPRRRLARKALLDCLLLVLSGSALGMLLTHWMSNLLSRSLLQESLPLAHLADPRLLLFALLVSALTTALVAPLPLLDALRSDVSRTLAGHQASPVGAMSRIRSVLVVLQVALTGILLVGAGLFLRSFQAASGLDKGFQAQGVLVADLPSLWNLEMESQETVELLRRFSNDLAQLPAFSKVAIASSAPLEGGAYAACSPEPQAGQADQRAMVMLDMVSEGYPEVLSLSLLEGRDFTARDTRLAPPVALVDASLARQFWPGQSALGRCIRFMSGPPCTQVVGVIADSRRIHSRDTRKVYLPIEQASEYPFRLLARVVLAKASGSPRLSALVEQVQRVSPGQNVRATALDAILDRDVQRWKRGVVLLGLLGALALLIAVVGTYGHLASWVAGRYHELGVRMALGLDGWRLAWLVLRQALLIGGAGAAAAVLGSLALYRLVQNLLYEVAFVDPWALGGSALLLMGIAVAGSLPPLWRASRVAPSQLLRAE